MSFLDQFSIGEIIAGLILILVVNTVVFKLLVDWNQAQPMDDGEALASPPGSVSSLSASDLESSPSLASSSVPPSNRPRRRKHLQTSAVTSAQPALVAETPPEPVTAHVAPAVENLAPVPEPVLPAAPPEETPQPMVAFSPEPEKPIEVVPVVIIPAFIESAPAAEPAMAEEKSPTPMEAVPVPMIHIPEPATPLEELIPALKLSPISPIAADPVADLPAVNTIAPESPAPAETTKSPKAEDLIPSSDLVLQPSADTSAQPPATPAPTVRSSFRRAIAPARLFLTREFSSVRIRSRQLTEPTVTPEPEPVTALVEPAAEEPALHSSEPATAAEGQPVPPVPEVPAAEVPAVPVPEPVTPLAEEIVPPVEAVSPAETVPPVKPPSVEVVVLAEPALPTAPLVALEPEPEPEPAAVVEPTPATVTEPTPPPAIVEPAPEPEPEPMPVAALEPAPVVPVQPESEPVHAPEAPASTPEPPVRASEVIPTSGLMHLPDPSETLPVVDIIPEAAIIPPPVVPVREEEKPSVIHPEPVISQPVEPFIPIPHMASVQPVTGERATAQLTLSLEVASLQLTPAFKLGSVQLRPLSNVVSLQLGAGVGPQPANNPLAANISFEIQSVQTGGDGQIQSLVLKPLLAARADTTPHPKLQVDAVQLTRGVEAGPIQITTASATSTAVQLLTTYAIAGIDFTPNFEIGTMRLEPVSRTVMLRLNQPGGAELPPAFEIATVQLGADAQISMVQLTPTTL